MKLKRKIFALKGDAKKEWYLKEIKKRDEEANEAGGSLFLHWKKRKFDEFEGVLEQSKENFNEVKDLDHYKTYKKWGIEQISGKLCEDWEDVKIAWGKAIIAPGADVVERRGMLLLGEFEGVLAASGTKDSVKSTMK